MLIENKDLDKISNLAYLKPSDPELLKAQLTGILNLLDTIQLVDTNGIEPLVTPVVDHIQFCDDVVAADLEMKNVVLNNAPKQKFGYFIVPKVIE